MNPLMLLLLAGGLGGGKGSSSNNILGLMMAPNFWFLAKLLGKPFGTRDILISKMMPQLAPLMIMTKQTYRRRPRRRYFNSYRRRRYYR